MVSEHYVFKFEGVPYRFPKEIQSRYKIGTVIQKDSSSCAILECQDLNHEHKELIIKIVSQEKLLIVCLVHVGFTF
jgi:hypothetical protein